MKVSNLCCKHAGMMIFMLPKLEEILVRLEAAALNYHEYLVADIVINSHYKNS